MMGKELQLAKHSPEFHIEEVGLDSPLLEAVVKLHTAGKSKLGPFPMGAFEDHARQKLILAAVASDKSVAGYLKLVEALTNSVVRLQTDDELIKKTFWNNYRRQTREELPSLASGKEVERMTPAGTA